MSSIISWIIFRIVLIFSVLGVSKCFCAELTDKLRIGVEKKNDSIILEAINEINHPSFDDYVDLELIYDYTMGLSSGSEYYNYIGVRLGNVVIQAYKNNRIISRKFIDKVYLDSKNALSFHDEDILIYAGWNIAFMDKTDGFEEVLAVLAHEDDRFRLMVRSINMFCNAYNQQKYDAVLNKISERRKSYVERFIAENRNNSKRIFCDK